MAKRMNLKIIGAAILIFAFVSLAGCAGLKQFPVVAKDYNQALRDLDAEYAEAVNQIYGPDHIEGTGAAATQTAGSASVATPSAGSAFVPPGADEQKRIRKVMMERRMAVIDANFKEFQTAFVKQNVQVEFGVAVLGVGVGAAGSLVTETASKILSAVSGGLVGAQAAYGKAALYDKAMSALVAQMLACRKAIAAQIFERWNLDLDKYPMWMAGMDLDAYYFAGTLPGAIMGTAADAKVKETQADDIILRKVTKVSVTDDMFAKRKELRNRIEKLDGDKAKTLVAAIEKGAQDSESFKDAKMILDDQYPADKRDEDKSGNTAIIVLKRAVVHTVRSAEEAKEWETQIGTIEKQ